MNGTIADPHNPRLCIWQARIKLSGSSHRIVCKLEGSGFNIDRHYLAMIAFLDLLAHLRLINLVTTSGKLFFAIAGLSNCHRLDLVSTITLARTTLQVSGKLELCLPAILILTSQGHS
jgi:hypothetical protein